MPESQSPSDTVLRVFPILAIFAAMLALPYVASFSQSTYGLKAESPINFYTLFPDAQRGEIYTAVSFGVAGCARSCPAQIGTLTALAETGGVPVRSIFMRAVPGNQADARFLPRGYVELNLAQERLARLAHTISGKSFAANAEQHDSTIYLFSPEGRLIFTYPYAFANAAKIAEDIRKYPHG